MRATKITTLNFTKVHLFLIFLLCSTEHTTKLHTTDTQCCIHIVTHTEGKDMYNNTVYTTHKDHNHYMRAMNGNITKIDYL